MTQQKPIDHERVRKIQGSFSWIPHTFVQQGFWSSLRHHELLLYLYLVIVSDRQGVSYYSFDRICTLLKINTDDYILARNALINKDLIAFDGYLFQVLSLPVRATGDQPLALQSEKDMTRNDPATIQQLIQSSLSSSKPPLPG